MYIFSMSLTHYPHVLVVVHHDIDLHSDLLGGLQKKIRHVSTDLELLPVS